EPAIHAQAGAGARRGTGGVRTGRTCGVGTRAKAGQEGCYRHGRGREGPGSGDAEGSASRRAGGRTGRCRRSRGRHCRRTHGRERLMFLVVFRNRKRPDIDQVAYDREAERMEELARQQPGFLSFKGYASDDGELIAVSEWDDEAAALGWRKVAEHRAAQQRGRDAYYEEYTLFACADPRIHRFSRKDHE